MFCKFGEYWELTKDIFNVLQEFVCRLYNVTKKDTHRARHTLLKKQLRDENENVDLSTLLPGNSVCITLSA